MTRVKGARLRPVPSQKPCTASVSCLAAWFSAFLRPSPGPSKPVIKPNVNLRATSGTLSSCQTAKRQNPSHFRRRVVLSRDFLHVAVLVNGLAIFIRNRV
jgi:hypothetical protein